jgi:DNA modification methylase
MSEGVWPEILIGDCREVLATLPSGSVHCCITSPPYWGLRDYGTATWEEGEEGCDHRHDTAHQKQGATSARAGRSNIEEQRNENFRDLCGRCGARRIDSQIGLEPTPELHIEALLEVFHEVWRVLRKDGTLWVNYGDCYTSGDRNGHGTRQGQKQGTNRASANGHDNVRPPQPAGLKPKDLVGMPWRLAFALQAEGWWLRSDIIWSKPNPMPSSVTDRPTTSHEYLFLLAKSERYFMDMEAIREPAINAGRVVSYNGTQKNTNHENRCYPGAKPRDILVASGRNRRTVWTIATQATPEAHFATFPEALVEPCILAGCPQEVCSVCLAPVVKYKHEQITQQDTVQTKLRRVRKVLRGNEQEVLQPLLRDEGSRAECPAEATPLHSVREGIQSQGAGRPLLTEVQRRLADGTGATPQTSMDGKASPELQGRDDQLPGLCESLRSNDEALSDAAPDGHGGDIGPEAQFLGVCSPSERDQNGQSAGESGADGKEPAQRQRRVPALREEFLHSVSTCCGAPLIPGTVLDPFAGSGTVSRVASRLGRRSIGIELSEEYVNKIARKRTNQGSLGL